MRGLIAVARERSKPDAPLGQALFQMLDWQHVLRRVETVELVTEYSVSRRVTIDVDVPLVLECWGPALAAAERRAAHIYVPVALLRKDLFVAFDMRDAAGTAIPVLPRKDDSYMAQAVLHHAATKVLGAELHQAIIDKLYAIPYSFPRYDIDLKRLQNNIPDPLPGEWLHDQAWNKGPYRQWSHLLSVREFRLLLAQFTTEFILLAPIRAEEDIAILKYAYQSPTDRPRWTRTQALGLQPAHVDLSTPNAGQGQAYHLRMNAPAGLIARDAEWRRADVGTAQPAISAVQALKKLAHFKIHLYARRIPAVPGLYVNLFLRAPVDGFLVTAFLSVLFNFFVLLGGWFLLSRLLQLTQSVDAAVTLLLAGPGVFAAYALRRAENAVVARVHRWPRVLVGLSVLLPYAAAVLLYLGPSEAVVRDIWLAVTRLAALASGLLGLMVACSYVGMWRAAANRQRPLEIRIESDRS